MPEAAPPWHNRTVLGVSLASLCSDVGHEMATSLMPVLLASVAGGSAALGLIEGISDGLASFAKLFSGLYSDRLERRKPLAVAGYVATACGMGSFALAQRWWHILLARAFAWTGRGARTPVRNVLMTEATEPSTRGRAFGFERAMDSAGAVIGPLLALSLLPLLGVRGALALTLIPGLAAALLIALLVEEKKHPPRPELGLRAALAGLPRDFRRFLLGVGVAGVGDFSNTLLILWAGQAWAPRFGALRAASLAIAFYAGYNVVYTLCAYFSGALADRFRKTRVLAAGYACAAVPAAALLWPGASLLKFALVFGLSGLYMGVWETVESAAAAEVLPAEGRGLGFGALATVNGCGDLVSSAVVGSLWALHPALAMGWVIASALCGCAIILGASAGSAARPA